MLTRYLLPAVEIPSHRAALVQETTSRLDLARAAGLWRAGSDPALLREGRQ